MNDVPELTKSDLLAEGNGAGQERYTPVRQRPVQQSGRGEEFSLDAPRVCFDANSLTVSS